MEEFLLVYSASVIFMAISIRLLMKDKNKHRYFWWLVSAMFCPIINTIASIGIIIKMIRELIG